MVKIEILCEKRQYFELVTKMSHRNILPGKSKFFLKIGNFLG